MELIGEGPCVIKAGDISTFEKAKILNPDLVLATLQKGATISMTMFSRFNKGYVTSEENQQVDLPVGTIFIDSNHSPVTRINYDVDNSRVDALHGFVVESQSIHNAWSKVFDNDVGGCQHFFE